MIATGEILVVFGGILWFVGLATFAAECERLPLQFLRWSVYQRGVDGRYGNDHGVEIGIRHRSARVATGFVAAASDTFDDDLIAAVGAAREKALILNAHRKSIQKRVP